MHEYLFTEGLYNLTKVTKLEGNIINTRISVFLLIIVFFPLYCKTMMFKQIESNSLNILSINQKVWEITLMAVKLHWEVFGKLNNENVILY